MGNFNDSCFSVYSALVSVYIYLYMI